MLWSHSVGTALILLASVVTAPLVVFVPAMVRRWLGWHAWWLTNQRLVVRTGFIGWRLQSVPLDRIVDVTLHASWWARLWGIEHIKVRDMTGEVGASGTSPNLRLLAVPNAQDVAELLLTSAPRIDGDREEMSEVVDLLKTLVVNVGGSLV
jgi:uncharacterized membrane protein YdbT with pleckstrin-like domain